MPLHYYHPNKAVKGFAASFWYSDRDDCVFATIIKQSGWDDERQNGTFKASKNDPTKNVTIKLSFQEVAGILDTIERNRPFSKFHDTKEQTKGISFTLWNTPGENPVPKGYSFSITLTNKNDAANKLSFYIGFSFAEAREIREFLIFAMHKHFNKMISKYDAPSGKGTKNTQLSDEIVDQSKVSPVNDSVFDF